MITKHYAGDDSDVKILMGGVLQAFAGWTVDAYQESAHSYLNECEHPDLGRIFRDCGFQPMVELLRYLEANGFTNYIASGGDRDFDAAGDGTDLRDPAGAGGGQLERSAVCR